MPHRFARRYVSDNSFKRLGLDLSRRLAEDRPDLVHVQYTAPLSMPVSRSSSAFTTSVSWSILSTSPGFAPSSSGFTVRRTIRRAARVITPSEFSRKRLLEAYHPDPAKVEVVPIAMSPTFRPLPHEGAFRWVSDRFKIRHHPYVLTVGDLQPRKNQIGLIRAFEELVRSNPQLPHRLVIVGKNTWFADRVMDTAKQSGVADRIVFTGFVNDDELFSSTTRAN